MALTAKDKESLLGGILDINQEANEASLKPDIGDAAWDALATDTSAEIRQMLSANPLKPEPVSPMVTPVKLLGKIARLCWHLI